MPRWCLNVRHCAGKYAVLESGGPIAVRYYPRAVIVLLPKISVNRVVDTAQVDFLLPFAGRAFVYACRTPCHNQHLIQQTPRAMLKRSNRRCAASRHAADNDDAPRDNDKDQRKHQQPPRPLASLFTSSDWASIRLHDDIIAKHGAEPQRVSTSTTPHCRRRPGKAFAEKTDRQCATRASPVLRLAR